MGKVDVVARKLIGKVPVGRGPIQVFVTPDAEVRSRCESGNGGRSGRFGFDRRHVTVVGAVKTEKGAHGVTIDNTGKYAYVTNTVADSVSVIDIAKRRVITTVKVGKMPNGITFLPAH